MAIIEYLTLANVLKVVIIIASAYIVQKIIEIGFLKPLRKSKKERGMTVPLKRIISIIVYAIAFIAILLVFDVDITAAAAGLGIGAIVIGFGLQDIISNWISGIIVITERIYRIGDVIRVSNITGIVTDITLRTTRLKTYDRNEVIIPNSKMIEEKIINLTSGRNESISSVTVSIDYASNIDKAKKIIENILRKDENVVVDERRKREIRFIIRTNEWTTEIETLFWTNKPKEEEFVKSRITEAINKEFKRRKILPPIRAPMRNLPGSKDNAFL